MDLLLQFHEQDIRGYQIVKASKTLAFLVHLLVLSSHKEFFLNLGQKTLLISIEWVHSTLVLQTIILLVVILLEQLFYELLKCAFIVFAILLISSDVCHSL